MSTDLPSVFPTDRAVHEQAIRGVLRAHRISWIDPTSTDGGVVCTCGTTVSDHDTHVSEQIVAASQWRDLENLQRRLFDECEVAEWDPEKTNTFAEEIAHLHEEVSEAFREWRLHKTAETRWTCVDCARSLPIETDLDTVRHPTSNHHYSGETSGHNCWGRFKPTGVPIEFADAIIGMFYNAELHGFDLFDAIETKHRYNLSRSYTAEGRQLHPTEGPRDTDPA